MNICKTFWNIRSTTLKCTGKRFGVKGILTKRGPLRTGAKLDEGCSNCKKQLDKRYGLVNLTKRGRVYLCK